MAPADGLLGALLALESELVKVRVNLNVDISFLPFRAMRVM